MEATIKSPIIKRSIVIAGHKTSVSLEDAFWTALKEIASERDLTVSELVGGIDARRGHANLSSAIRLFVLEHFRSIIEQTPDLGSNAPGRIKSFSAAS
jgi:predicted DNA-binding ribbon-helix-helix protein